MFNRPVWEVLSVMFVYFLFHIIIVDSIYGTMIGFGEPLLSMIWGAPHRFVWVTNIRSWILIFSTVLVGVAYAYIRPRLAGEDIETYWSPELDTEKEND